MNCIVILLPRRALHLFSVKGFYPALPATASATPPAEVWGGHVPPLQRQQNQRCTLSRCSVSSPFTYSQEPGRGSHVLGPPPSSTLCPRGTDWASPGEQRRCCARGTRGGACGCTLPPSCSWPAGSRAGPGGRGTVQAGRDPAGPGPASGWGSCRDKLGLDTLGGSGAPRAGEQ